MKPNWKVFVSALVFALLLTGCTRRLIDFSIISNKNVRLDLPEDATGPRVEGKHSVVVFLTIPFGTPSIEEATDRAIEKAGPPYDALAAYATWLYSVDQVELVSANTTSVKAGSKLEFVSRPRESWSVADTARDRGD